MVVPADRSRGGGRLMAVDDAPAAHLDRQRWTRPLLGVVVSEHEFEPDPAIEKPGAEASQVGGGPGAGAGRLDEITGHDQPGDRSSVEQGGEPGDGLGQGVRRDDVATPSARPLVPQVGIGDHRDTAFVSSDDRPLRSKPPAVGAFDQAIVELFRRAQRNLRVAVVGWPTTERSASSLFLPQHMNLIFDTFELICVVLSVLIVNLVVADGESNWLEGVQLLVAYAIMAISFFFHT